MFQMGWVNTKNHLVINDYIFRFGKGGSFWDDGWISTQMSNEKKGPWLFRVNDEKLPRYIGIIS